MRMMRVIKGLASIVCVSLALVLLFSVVDTKALANSGDEFDELRLKWRYKLTGEQLYTLPVTDPELQSKINLIDSRAQSLWDSMDKTGTQPYLWSDVPVDAESRHLFENYSRLSAMTMAYATKGSALEGDAALLNDLKYALDWMYANQYNETIVWSTNYHYWEITAPSSLTRIVVLLYDQLSPSQINNYMNAVNAFAYDPTTYALSTTPSYGANRLWESLPIMLRGIIVKDGSRLELVRDRLSDYEAKIYPFVKTLNGWYRDGSFIAHDRHPYNGAYGLGHYATFVDIKSFLEGTTWQLTDPRSENVYSWTYDGYVPLIRNARMMDMVSGRNTASQTASDQLQGRQAIGAMLTLAESAPAEHAAYLKQVVKMWLQGDAYPAYAGVASIPELLAAKQVMEDPAVVPVQPLLYRQYPGMDRAVQQTPGYAFGLSMFSKRIYDFEAIGSTAKNNVVNKKGWYTSSGMTYVYNDDLTQYDNSFWITVDMKRLPGTTIDAEEQRPLGDDSKLNSRSWVGGVEIGGLYGASGMELEGYNNTLSAKKSWFAFDDEIVALGSDIVSTDNRTIETVVENRKLNAAGSNVLTVDGLAKSAGLGWSESMSQVDWMHLQGDAAGAAADIGYYFPAGADVQGLREQRTGSWSDITDVGPNDSATNRFLNLWLDHGRNPSGAGYAYVLLPGKTATQVGQYAAAPNITILEQSAYVHAVKENTLNVVAAHFWTDVKRTVAGITVDKKASVAVKESAEEIEVAVADPTQENRGMIEVEIAKSAARVIAADPAVKVLRLAPTIKLAVQANGSGGMTSTIKLHKTDADEQAVVTLLPAADASVHNGTQALMNYGEASTLSVRDAVYAGDQRIAYLKFDVSAVQTVDSAKLRLTASVPSGAVTALSVLGGGDSWTESGLVWGNQPGTETNILGTVFVNGMERYYEVDVTEYVRQQAAGDGAATFVVTGADYESLNIAIHSREHSYGKPQLVIDGVVAGHSAVAPTVVYDEPYNDALNESFDTMSIGALPSPWQVAAHGGSASVAERAAAPGSRELELAAQTAGGTVQAARSFAARSGLVYAEYRVRVEQAGATARISLADQVDAGGAGAAGADVVFGADGRIAATDGDGGAPIYLQPYAPGVWYKVKLIIDTTLGRYDVYIDEAVKARDIRLGGAGAAGGGIGGVGGVLMELLPSGTGTVRIDDVRVASIDTREPWPTVDDIRDRDTADDIPMPLYSANDHFNGVGTGAGIPTGWNLVQDGGSVGLTASPDAANRSLRIYDASTTLESKAMRAFSPLSGHVVIDYWIMAGQTNKSFGGPYVFDSGNNDTGVIVFSSDGNIKAYNGATVQTLMPYSANKWYRVKLEMDTDKDTFDLYVDGRLVANQFAFRKKVGAIGRVNFFFGTTATGTMYVDNLRVHKEEDAFVYAGGSLKPEVHLLVPDLVSPGDEFRASLRLSNPRHDVKAERFVVRYDAQAFDYTRVETAAGLSGASYTVTSTSPGYLTITLANVAGVTGDADLLDVVFTARSAAVSAYGALSLESADLYLPAEDVLLEASREQQAVLVRPLAAGEVYEHFNGAAGALSSDWTLVTAGGTVQAADLPNRANRSLRLDDTSSSLTTEATRQFGPLSGTVVIEYRVMTGQNDVSVGVPYVFDTGTNDTGVIVFSGDGSIKAYNGASAQSLMSYEANRWYRMKLVLNTDTDRYDVYVDGVLVADQYQFRKKASAIAKVKLLISTTPRGTVNIDNLHVYQP